MSLIVTFLVIMCNIGYSNDLSSYKYKNTVYYLEANNVESFIDGNNKTIVLYTKEHHLKSHAAMNELERASIIIKNKYNITDILFGIYQDTLDTDEDRDVDHTPTLQYCAVDPIVISLNALNNESNVNLTCHTYTHDISETLILTYLLKMNGFCSERLDSKDDITQFISKNEISLVGYFDNINDGFEHKYLLNKDELALTIFDGLCKKYWDEDHQAFIPMFGYIVNKDLFDDLTENDELPYIVMINNYKPNAWTYNGNRLSEQGLQKFIEIERFPDIVEVDGINYGEFMNSNAPIVWIAIDDDNPKFIASTERYFTNYAQKYKETCLFVWISSHKFIEHVRQLGMPWVPGIYFHNIQSILFNQEHIFE